MACGGHVQAAQALVATGKRYFPQFEFIHLDLLTLASKPVRDLYNAVYFNFIHNNPSAWLHADLKSKPVTASDPRGIISLLATPSLLKKLLSLQPAACLSTHYLAAQILTELRFTTSLICTDFGINPWWAACGAETFYVACTETIKQLECFGVDRARCCVFGIPINPAFSQIPDKQRCRQLLWLAEYPTILLLGGGSGLGDLDLKADALSRRGDFQIVAIAGRNKELRERLKRLQSRTNGQIRAFGFTNSIPYLLRAADIVWMKPGGLSTAEALAVGTALVVDQPVAAQELHNVNFLHTHEAASIAYNLNQGVNTVCNLLVNVPCRLSLEQVTRELGKPDAARQILQRTVDMLRPL